MSQNGTLEAPDQAAAVAILHKRGLLLLQIEAAGSPLLRTARGQMKGQALVSFTQQLATLLGAGQPLERALNLLLKQPGPAPVRALIER
ncbi:type II secretion system protein GspF, partial [Burkholderia sp. SIMBA_013]